MKITGRRECGEDAPPRSTSPHLHRAFDAAFAPFCPFCGRYEGAIAAEHGCDACLRTLDKLRGAWTGARWIARAQEPALRHDRHGWLGQLITILQPYVRAL